MIGRWLERVSSLFRKSELDREFQEEADSHIDLATADYLQRGMSLPDARRLARSKFGSIAASKDAHRDSRGVPWLERFLFYWSLDFIKQAVQLWIRQATRQMALTIFLILSLAISLAGGVFALSLNSAVLWRSLPFENARDLVSIQAMDPAGQPRWLSWRELDSLTESRIGPFESIAGFTAADFNALSEPGLPPEPLSATIVSRAFFDTFGVRVALGGLPPLEVYGASRHRVVLLTYDCWQRRYRGTADILGRSIRLSRPEYLGGGDEGYRVIGILRRDTWLFWKDFDVVLPMQADRSRIGDPSRGLFERTVGRTIGGSTISSSRSSAPILLERIRIAGSNRPTASLSVSALQDAIFADLKPQLTVILWLAIAAFSLAGINVVISTIAQATEQRHSTAIRLAVGASYTRLFGDTLYQHAITLSLSTAICLALAQWLVVSIGSQMPDGWLARIPGQLSALRIDANVLWWLVAAVLLTIVCSGGSVHTLARRLKPWSLLASTISDDQRSRKWRSILVGVEIALCAAVVITSVTLVSQLTTLRSVNMGVDPTRTSAIWVNLGSATLADPASRVAYYDRILQETESLSGIESVGGISHPFNIGWESVQVRDASSATSPDVTALARSATTAYLPASGIAMVEGRWFKDGDRANAPKVAVLSESLARARWPGRSAIGQQVTTEATSSPATVVGVVVDTRHAPHLPPDRILYRPVAQEPPPWLYLIVRARPGVSDAAKTVSEAVWRVNPDQPVDGPWAVSEWIDNRTAHLRFLTLIAIVLGAVSLVLAAAGLYALTSWSVTSSKRSIAVRRAIGGSNRQILSWYVSEWVKIVVPGLAGGWILQSLWTSTLVAAIPGLQAPTPFVVTVGTSVMAVAAAVAAMVPLRRALVADTSSLMRSS